MKLELPGTRNRDNAVIAGSTILLIKLQDPETVNPRDTTVMQHRIINA